MGKPNKNIEQRVVKVLVVMAITRYAGKESRRARWGIKNCKNMLIGHDIGCWNNHTADCALAWFFHERRCDTKILCLLTSAA